MKNSHTPAPWQFFSWSDKCGVTHDSGDIAHCGAMTSARSHAEAEANARLIAAAPDMLHALQQVDAFFTACGKHGEYAGRVHTHPLVKAAIAKATGEAAVLSPAHKAKESDPFDDFCYQCDQGD